jgi:hypothetical protein
VQNSENLANTRFFEQVDTKVDTTQRKADACPNDPDLKRIIAAWGGLPSDVKIAMLALVSIKPDA